MKNPWEEDDKQLGKVIKKAKRKTLIRNILISLIASIMAIFLVQFGALQLTYRASDKALKEEWLHMSLTSPNEYESGYSDQRGFLSGALEISSYKIVEGVPIPWGNRVTEYKVPGFPKFTGLGGGGGNLTVVDSRMEAQSFMYYRQYNDFNGQRELMFYVPGVDYNGKILNDLEIVGNIGTNKVAEMAISFDKDYSFDEVRAMLPAEVTQMWYWVDTYNNRQTFNFKPFKDERGETSYPLPMTKTYNVYGFGVRPDWDQAEAGVFLQNLQLGIAQGGRYAKEYERIYSYLKKDKNEPDKNDVRILGAVVTGTAEELQSLRGQTYVRAAVLGAIAEKY
ncbi:anti-sigma factor [Paenibacillus macerans]|uniref:anti-sigma factor n=1 Tax=Paenibacillus macerans TaxID=44252 RepID=UPI00203CC9E6|nr:anti-sigma factor [Paenibacillus macerans]MCM3699956.1 anti-sigma factor [Paenibacillus macerans]